MEGAAVRCDSHLGGLRVYSLSSPCFAQGLCKKKTSSALANTHIPPRGEDFASFLRTGSAGGQIKAKSLKQKLCFGAWCEMTKKRPFGDATVPWGAQASVVPGVGGGWVLRAGSLAAGAVVGLFLLPEKGPGVCPGPTPTSQPMLGA